MRTKILKTLLVAVPFLVAAIFLFNTVFSSTPGSQPLIPQRNAPASNSDVDLDAQQVAPTISAGDLVPQGFQDGQETKRDVSPALRNIPPKPEQPVTGIREVEKPGINDQIRQFSTNPAVVDPVVQSSLPVQPLALSTLTSWNGVGNLDGVYPPDTNGDVGPNNYVQIVNLHFQIWNKSGTSLYGPALNNTLWTGFGGNCETSNDGDPVVLYDSIANRWIMSQFTATSPYGECVAVSTTGDPTGSYYRYFFQFSTSIFYDYPKLGVWPDGYYLSANRFNGNTFSGPAAIALNRSAMLNGQPATFREFDLSSSFGTLLPADLDGATLPTSGEPEFYAEIASNTLHIWKFHVDWTTPSNSTLTGPTSLAVAAFNQLCATTRSCVPQPSTSVGLDGLGDRLMHRLVYRNFGDHEALLVNHSVNVLSTGKQAGVRWYEVRNPNGTATLYQQGSFAPDTTNRWMGSVAFDSSGDIAMGYSVSSSSLFPSLRFTGRLATDALGQMTQGETTLIAGSGSQTGTGSRWGDYANISIDPVDDCTFWFTSEYMPSTGTAPWQTRIGSFKFPNCGSTSPTPTPTNTAVPPTATNTPTPTASNTPGPTPTNTNTPIPPTATNTPTNTPVPLTPTNTPVPPTATNTPAPTATNTPGACANPSGGYCRTNNETHTWLSGATASGVTGDDQSRAFTLPFTFNFAGTNYTSINIVSNGFVNFGTSSTAYSNVAIPNTARPNAYIAPFWDDLNPSVGGAIYTAVYGSAPNRVFVVEWRNVPHYGAGSNGATFEIQLEEGTNGIWMLYQDTTFGSTSYNNGVSATVGVENTAGSAGNQFSFNQGVITPTLVLHFWPQ